MVELDEMSEKQKEKLYSDVVELLYCRDKNDNVELIIDNIPRDKLFEIMKETIEDMINSKD